VHWRVALKKGAKGDKVKLRLSLKTFIMILSTSSSIIINIKPPPPRKGLVEPLSQKHQLKSRLIKTKVELQLGAEQI
jgi:hypothetical protein